MKNKDFCHLHTHNEYSQLDGLGTGEQYAQRARQMGFKYLALTNHANIDGLIKFQKACQNNDIVPIHGCELYIVEKLEATESQKSKLRGHLNVHVKSQKGFDNLCRMLTLANTEGFYYKPLVDYKIILENHEGLCFSTACLISFLRVLPNGKKFFSDLYDCVGKDLYCEIMPHRIDTQPGWNRKVIRTAKKYGLKIYASNDCHYIKRTDAISQEVSLAIQRKALWTDKKRFRFSLRTFHLKSAIEMIEGLNEFGQYKPEYLTNTMEIAEKCAGFTIPKKDIDLPAIPNVPINKAKEKLFLWDLCLSGYQAKFEKSIMKDGIYLPRLQEEFGLIASKNFQRYFLMVWELINWCKENSILVGPGRGSVGGSLTAYLLGITAVDPIKHDLLFSRFINEDRIDYPDIDIDFEDSKRHLVRQHLESVYGEKNVAGVSAFSRMKARAVLKDVGRVFGIHWMTTNKFTKFIEDNDEHTGIQDAIDNHELCQKFARRYPQVIKLAKKLEGTVRGYSQHAAALVVSKDPIGDSGRCNLILNKDGSTVVNWEKEDTEFVGLMKLDALGLKLLSIFSDALQLISTNQNKNIDLEKINLNDKAVLRDINNGQTVGIFQLGTWAMTALITKMGVTEFRHLSDAVALVRPGPTNSGMTEEYIKRKRGAKWKKLHPVYEEITKETYGIICYQEQIMQVIYKVAGLPYNVADKIRKIIGKKRSRLEFEKYKNMFVQGCKKTGYFSPVEAEEFWTGLEEHARYSFNKSHSVEYAILGYWCGWLKRYFPTEFMCASLTHGAQDKKPELIEEAYRLGLTLVLPKVGRSHESRWTVKEKQLWIPFSEVKGIGPAKALQAAKAPINESLNIRKFFTKNAGVVETKRFSGAFGNLLHKIGAYDSSTTHVVSEEVKQLFKFRITSNPREEYQNLYRLFGDKLRLDQLDLVLEGNPDALKKIVNFDLISSGKEFIRHRTLSKCELCQLIDECKAPVQPSPGKLNVMIIGEAPGKDEDEQREGFVGRSGEKIWSYLKGKGYTKDLFHVTNVVKCFPKKSRKPNNLQINICGKEYLEQEIDWIEPKIILAFGNTCLDFFLGQASGIMSLSGKKQWLEKYQAWLVWCMHPAASLHNPNNAAYFKTGMKSFVELLHTFGISNKV